LSVWGPNSCFPIAGQSKRQSCVSHSAPEAEIVACYYSVRMSLLPSISLWDKLLLGTFDHVLVLGDNEAMCRVINTGKNPTMRYLHRTHGVSIARLHERLKTKKTMLKLAGICTSRMCADIFTKGFTGAAEFLHASALINVGLVEQLLEWWTELSDMRLNAAFEDRLDTDGDTIPKDKSKVIANPSLMIASLTAWGGMQLDIELPKKYWNLGARDRRQLRKLVTDVLRLPLGKVRRCVGEREEPLRRYSFLPHCLP
jgi:hypothetical protein